VVNAVADMATRVTPVLDTLATVDITAQDTTDTLTLTETAIRMVVDMQIHIHTTTRLFSIKFEDFRKSYFQNKKGLKHRL
jgi:hypothetical protein